MNDEGHRSIVDASPASASPFAGGEAQQARVRARARWARAFRVLTLVPVVAALALLATLFADVVTDAVSWQVVRPAGSGESWSFSEGFRGTGTWRRVTELELRARGVEPAAVLGDPEEARKFRARHRVELMWVADGAPLRWVVTSSRDDPLADLPLFTSSDRLEAVRADLAPDERLYLNPWLDASFLTKDGSRTPILAGLRSALIGTFWVIGLVIAIALPLGVGTALYLEEYAPDNRLTRALDVNLRNLAGVPSIVYGILGLYAFVRLARLGPTVLAAALTLSLLILPVVVIASREAIRAVPRSLRQASYGLGATKWQTVSRVVVPNSAGGIVTGIILAVARAIGETAPLLLVGAAAYVPRAPEGPLSNYTVVPIQIYGWVSENDPEFQHVASAAILALLAVLIALYAAAFYVRRRFERRTT